MKSVAFNLLVCSLVARHDLTTTTQIPMQKTNMLSDFLYRVEPRIPSVQS